MKVSTKRTIAGSVTFLIAVFSFWLAGENFDERGPTLAFRFWLCVAATALVVAFPFNED